MSKNQVLADSFKPSQNFFKSDLILNHYLQANLTAIGFAYMSDALQATGHLAATTMDEYSLNADKQPPVLVKRNALGRTVDQIKFHPHYWSLMSIAVESKMMHVKWEGNNYKRFKEQRHTLGFSAGFLYGMSELGQFCPLCMTDGAARLIRLFCSEEDKNRLLPKIGTLEATKFFTGAMFLTEKAGGSDVGANLVKAEHLEGKYYQLSGEKWFCSNVNADVIFALARTDISVKGTKGLSLFLIEKTKQDGTRNPLNIQRLKDKLGVRSMASAECVMETTEAKLVGEEFKGFQTMTEMINLSRLYNSLAAVSGMRRALIEAYQFLCHRETFRKRAIEHALIREKLLELGSLYVADFYITWRTIKALDQADNGNEQEKELVRILTPMIKKCTAANAVYVVRESMELMGGMGYIEDSVVPKIMRDVMVLPIWEGAGNIMTLDMLRAAFKSQGIALLIAEIQSAIEDANPNLKRRVLDDLQSFSEHMSQLGTLDQDTMESAGRFLMDRLTLVYKLAVLLNARDENSLAWIDPAVAYFADVLYPKPFMPKAPPSVEVIHGLIAWEVSGQ